jgi:hypothetical protein
MSREWIKQAVCPTCAAAIGDPCVNKRGEARTAHHNTRRAAASASRPKREKGARGYVYFFLCSGTATVKIGVTASHPARRRRSLQTGAPGELRLLVYAPGTAADERRLHRRFAHLRRQGEWFAYKDDLHDFVRALVRSAGRGGLAPTLDVEP